MKRNLGIAIGIFVIIAMLVAAYFLGIYPNTTPEIENRAKSDVKKMLIDPYSAHFDRLFISKTNDVCGFVNSRNRMGAYAGESRFSWNQFQTMLTRSEPPSYEEIDAARHVPWSQYSRVTDMTKQCNSEETWLVQCESKEKNQPLTVPYDSSDTVIACISNGFLANDQVFETLDKLRELGRGVPLAVCIEAKKRYKLEIKFIEQSKTPGFAASMKTLTDSLKKRQSELSCK